MNSNDLAVAIAKRRADLENAVFRSPPQDHYEFKQRLGVWIGLGESLGIIEDAAKREMKDD